MTEQFRKRPDMLEAIGEAALILDPGAGRILQANEMAVETLGYSREQLMSLAVADLHPFEMDAFEEFAESVARQGCQRTGALTCRTAAGEFLPADIKAMQMELQGQSCILALIRRRAASAAPQAPETPADRQVEEAVSEDDRLLRRLSTTQFVLDHAPEMVLWVTPEGRIHYANRTAAEVLEYTRSELERSWIWDVDALLAPSEFPQQVQAFRQSGRVRTERRMRTRQGSTFPVSLTVQAIEYDGREYLISFSRDISDEVHARQAAEQYLETLTRISRRHSLGQMASALTHEIQQPLTALANYVRMTQRLLEQENGGGGRLGEMVDKSVASVERTLTVMRRVRAYVSHREPQMENIPPGTLVAEFRALAETELAGQGVSMEVVIGEPLPRVQADSVLIQQVLMNLVRNAAEAMQAAASERCVVRIRAYAEDRWVVVSVEDSGPGLSESAASALFEPFRSAKPDGLGVGLFLSRAIMDSHGGDLWHETVPEGTAFRFRLPVAGTAVPARAAADESGVEPHL